MNFLYKTTIQKKAVLQDFIFEVLRTDRANIFTKMYRFLF